MSVKKHLGLEINDQGVRYAELVSSKDSFSLGKWGETILPAGVIENGSIKNVSSLNKSLTAI